MFCERATIDVKLDVGRNEDERTVIVPDILVLLERWRVVVSGRCAGAFSGREDLGLQCALSAVVTVREWRLSHLRDMQARGSLSQML